MVKDFRAFVFNSVDGKPEWEVKKIPFSDLPDGEVTIRVAYSGVNYKDGLVANGLIKSSSPLIPGIDLSGTVIKSADGRFHEGDKVIVTSYELGVTHHGGFSEVARVPAEWVVPLPDGLSLKQAMVIGTAGFTAALSVQRLEENGARPDKGPILVTGATGGVGSIAVNILSSRGYEVTASTGKTSEHDYLRHLGANQIVHRDEVTATDVNHLRQEHWAGVVDPVGGKTLEYALSTLQYGGSVALSGLAGGTDISTAVYAFIKRGVNLLGIDSVYCPMETRVKVWNRLGTDLKPNELERIISCEIQLDELEEVLPEILKGSIRGRIIVKI